MSIFRPIPVADAPSTKLPWAFRFRRRAKRIFAMKRVSTATLSVGLVCVAFGYTAIGSTCCMAVLVAALTQLQLQRKPTVLLPAPKPPLSMPKPPPVTYITTRVTHTTRTNTNIVVTNCPRCRAMFVDAFNISGGVQLACRDCGWSTIVS